ncbi:hypothetical protein POM88_024719 [Heracleum sosnowskyi]|uniref:Uncharacterized protein n=1 Tax=Heracleum sosnowskyi TaxID=360622 RepID=A0AAD8I3J1_9APIA|nr:hypothetical protein POM88_024719 [Heracleum sosnowskyi]
MEDESINNIDSLFWLPSDFLTDDDDDDLSITSNNQLPTDLTPPVASANKWALSGSPQSILSPVLSNGSPNSPSSPTAPLGQDDKSWNLICAAAGEVNMLKMRNETAHKNRAPPTPPNIFTPLPASNKYINNHVKQNMGSVWGRDFGVSAEYGCGFSGNARCGRAQRLFQSGWPSLQAQNQHFNANGCVSRPSFIFAGGVRNVAGGGVGLKKKCAGTGVFLPRTCADPTASPVKPGCPAPALNVKCNYDVMSKAQVQSTVGCVNPGHDAMLIRRNAVLAQWHNGMNVMGNRAMSCKMLLPEEWSY